MINVPVMGVIEEFPPKENKNYEGKSV